MTLGLTYNVFNKNKIYEKGYFSTLFPQIKSLIDSYLPFRTKIQGKRRKRKQCTSNQNKQYTLADCSELLTSYGCYYMKKLSRNFFRSKYSDRLRCFFTQLLIEIYLIKGFCIRIQLYNFVDVIRTKSWRISIRDAIFL